MSRLADQKPLAGAGSGQKVVMFRERNLELDTLVAESMAATCKTI